jgi:formate dehydrogenase iron-sulfur subunit
MRRREYKMAEQVAMLIDVSKCMGCRGCQVACKQWNRLPAEKTKFTGSYQNPLKLSAKTWTLVQFIEPEDYPENPRWLFRKNGCFHCTDATCEQVCPTKAIRKKENGIVYINQGICAGCKACVEACPFHIPHPSHSNGTARKCWMCLDRVENGLRPACATACPTGAVSFGLRSEILDNAKKRKAVLESEGLFPRIYGENELGGLHVITLLPESASTYGLPENPKKPTQKIFWRWVVAAIPGLAILGGIGRYLAKDSDKEEAEAKAKTGGE